MKIGRNDIGNFKCRSAGETAFTGLPRLFAVALIIMICLSSCFLSGCKRKEEKKDGHLEVKGLEYEDSLKLEYAKGFSVYEYKGGYKYIEIKDGDKIFLVPEGGKLPEDLPDDLIVLKQPLDRIYLAATSAMALFDAMDSLDEIKFASLEAGDWYVENASKAMEAGKMAYAGKYGAPDFEMLTAGSCDLSIQSTMIFHKPESKEKLEELGIPVIVERSSYETHPLGRTEWVKFYGALLGKDEEAKKAFDAQAEKVKNLNEAEPTGKKVAFFYINRAGNVVTYKSVGYVPEMIRLAGGEYALKDKGDDTKLSSMNMSMESFYAEAGDADIIIYNSSIVSTLKTKEEFLALAPVLADFKAVKEDNVWCTSKSMFQETDKVGTIIEDMHKIFTDQAENDGDLSYIHKLT
jgi:iron complex transport system substrate-binding protein